MSTDPAYGPVAVCVFPGRSRSSRRTGRRARVGANRLDAEVLTTTEIGNRVRLGLAAPQPLAAEVTLASAEQLALHTGARVTATWKATATRLVAT